jgi:nucleotide-binding universal stress UspA family protein
MRVLVATDGSECSYAAARLFIRLVHATHCEIKALYVIPLLPLGRDTGFLEIEEEREAMGALNTVRTIFSQVGLSIQTEIRQGIPADTILEVAEKENFDLIVIGHHGRGGFKEFLLGSVSKVVAHKATCSVLIGR